MSENGGHDAAGPSNLKRSLFIRAAWPKPAQSLDNISLFHRASRVYVNTAADTERDKNRKQTREKKKRAREDGRLENSAKRSRAAHGNKIDDDDDSDDDENNDDVEEDDDEDNDNSSADEEEESLSRDRQVNHLGTRTAESSSQRQNKDRRISRPNSGSSDTRELHSSPLRQYQPTIAEGKLKDSDSLSSLSANIIDLDEVQDSIKPGINNIRETIDSDKSQNVLDLEETAPDEVFPELARQARENARKKRLEEDNKSRSERPPPDAQDTRMPPSQDLFTSNFPPALLDPVLQILVTSSIDGSQPLIVSRRLSQRLKDVRIAWVERQNFGPGLADTIFLTWRGKRLFDVTSCKSLGIKVDADGNISSKGDILGHEEGHIHMEAMTANILEAYKKAKSGDTTPAAENQAVHSAPSRARHDVEPQVRIILKAKGFEDFKLAVKPSTLISKIVNAFRTANRVQPEKEVFLSFDDERILPDFRVGETDLSDLDHVDVYVR